MGINKFYAIVLMAFSVAFLPFESARAQTGAGLTGDMVTITYITPAGTSIVTVSAADILNAFGNAFLSIKDAVREVLAEIAAAEEGAAATASRDVWISSKVKVNIMSTGIGAGSSGGGGSCDPSVASCN